MKFAPIFLMALAATLGASAPGNASEAAPTSAVATSTCPLGAYRSAAGELIAITPNGQGEHLWHLNGRLEIPGASDASVTCRGGKVIGRNGEVWTKLRFRSKTVAFFSHGTRLQGVLLLPAGTRGKPPLVVLVSGSEKRSPNGSLFQQMFTAQGVATFAYDKRGTGKSGGVYTQDFHLLGDDAAAAVKAARKACPHCFSRVGLHGGSQGGWVAPIAALEAKVDFLEVSFGVVGTALEQDRWQVDYQLRELGFHPGAAVHAVTDATAVVAASNWTKGLDRVAALRRKYGQEPWFKALEGQYTGEVVRGERKQWKAENPNVSWHFDTRSVLRKLKIPQLWVFAEEDSVAPSAHSIARLQKLRRAGRNITIVRFPNTDHSITTFVTEAPGKRRITGVADGFLRLIADWARHDAGGRYGTAEWLTPRSDATKN